MLETFLSYLWNGTNCFSPQVHQFLSFDWEIISCGICSERILLKSLPSSGTTWETTQSLQRKPEDTKRKLKTCRKKGPRKSNKHHPQVRISPFCSKNNIDATMLSLAFETAPASWVTMPRWQTHSLCLRKTRGCRLFRKNHPNGPQKRPKRKNPQKLAKPDRSRVVFCCTTWHSLGSHGLPPVELPALRTCGLGSPPAIEAEGFRGEWCFKWPWVKKKTPKGFTTSEFWSIYVYFSFYQTAFSGIFDPQPKHWWTMELPPI